MCLIYYDEDSGGWYLENIATAQAVFQGVSAYLMPSPLARRPKTSLIDCRG